MNKDQLTKGCQLWERIKELKREKEMLEKAEKTHDLRFSYAGATIPADVSLLSFPALKKSVLCAYDKEIKNLEREFAKL